MKLPHIISISGFPGSGKSEVQRILKDVYGVQPIDDGDPLRKFAIQRFGMSHDDVYTQEGKKRSTDILGKSWVNRKALGELGNVLEATFGAHIMPFMATRNLDPALSYSFGSVRRDQGKFYKNMGGVAFGVERPGTPPSPHEFDQFDRSVIDCWVINDGTLEDLAQSVALILEMLQDPNALSSNIRLVA